MPPARFYSYNVITSEQQDRLARIRQPESILESNNPTLFNTWAINQRLNDHANDHPITARHDIHGTVIEVDAPAPGPAQRRHHGIDSDGGSDSDFLIRRIRRPAQRGSPNRRRNVQVPAERRPTFVRKLNQFREKWNREFPDKPCVECGTLLLPRHRRRGDIIQGHEYGLTRVFGIPVRGPFVILCKYCVEHPRNPVDVGPQPECIRTLEPRSTKFLSPFQLDSNLGRTSGYNLRAIPFNYRMLNGRMATRTQNPRAIALYSGVLGAWLETSRYNRHDQDHDLAKLEQCRDWLLQNNAVFQRNDVRANIQVPDPLPLLQLIQDHRDERRPQNRPDFVMDPMRHDAETRNEDFRFDRVTIGRVQGSHRAGNLPELFRTDPEAEVMGFSHLYPWGRGQWIERPIGGNGRRESTLFMDVKMKLNSINPVFRRDHYWPGWVYQEMEARRIQQNNFRMVNNTTRQAIDNRLPQYRLLQQSQYGRNSIVNELITQTIPGFIRTGEKFFHEKEAMINAMIQACGLPTLFITVTFNEKWREFQDRLPRTGRPMPSDYPWEGIRLYYERLHHLQNKFWKTPAARFGDLKEMVTRHEFQLRGAIHSHIIFWVTKTIDQMISEKFIRADLPDEEFEPELYYLVQKYMVHECKRHICGGPGAGPNGKCKKLFPQDISDRTYHRQGDKRYTYERTARDVWVGPYHAELLLLWEGHINVQYVTSDDLVAYMVKYVTKLEPNSLFERTSGNTRMTSHILARRMGSMEQIVLCLGLPLVRCTTSSVFLPTATPGMRNSTVRPPHEIEQDPDNPYYPDALEKYFARPECYEDLTYFKYFQLCELRKKRVINSTGPRMGVQDTLGYWVYQRDKTKLIRTPYRRLCDGENFFFHHLLNHNPWRSDDEIRGGCETYRERLFTLNPTLFQNILAGYNEREIAGRLAVGNEYLEMVQRIAEAVPFNLQTLISQQLEQLNTMRVPGLLEAASVTLRGEQYAAYTTMTQNIRASPNGGRCFFVTGPGGTGKSYLLKAFQHWCDVSRNPCMVVAPTGIAARNVGGSTIHSAMAIFTEAGQYRTALFSFNEAKLQKWRECKVLIIDEISMVEADLLDKMSTIMMKIKNDGRPWGGTNVMGLGDLLQLPPVSGQKVWKSVVWPLFYPIFLREPQRQNDRRFFDVLNKIRFGIVDEDVRLLLTQRWQSHNPVTSMWKTTYLCPLKDEAEKLNDLCLTGLPGGPQDSVYYAEDYENDERLTGPSRSRVFRRNTNFAPAVTCKMGAKVMFLTNSMLDTKGIANGSLGVIVGFLENGDIEAAFPTEGGIQILELHRTTSAFTCSGVEYRRYQLPILNAFALTVHKVQGLSLSSVTIALGSSMFAEGQAYVGLSRATKLEELFITQLDFSAIKADPEAIAEYGRLERVAASLRI